MLINITLFALSVVLLALGVTMAGIGIGGTLDRLFAPHVAAGNIAVALTGILVLWSSAPGVAPLLGVTLVGPWRPAGRDELLRLGWYSQDS